MRRATTSVSLLLAGTALGVGGTLGVQAATEEDTSESSVRTVTAHKPSFRSEVREALAEEWGDRYSDCIENLNRDNLGPPNPIMKKACRGRANELLP
jgi:hypothetical protein